MKITPKTDITIKDICDGFVYNELEGRGLYGLSGKLTIQPEGIHGQIIARCTPPEAVLEEKAFDGKTILEIEGEMTNCILR